jgi:hypothetical protein
MKSLEETRIEKLDKFYTNTWYSKKCIEKVNEIYDINSFDTVIEPSAGDGSFYKQIIHNNKIGIDIAPEDDNIIKKDFFDFQIKNGKNLTIGNPPFGKVSSLAIKFFNHASEFSDVIAFIIPRTFRKTSIQNKLNLDFHLIHDEDTPLKPCCFYPNMSVKCCFQIWQKKNIKRINIKLPIIHKDWEFVKLGPKDNFNQPTPPEFCDFAIRAYGGKIGEIKIENLEKLRPKSWHWIKSNIDKNILIDTFKKLDYSNSLNTARQNSMGKSELVELYTVNSESK